MSSTALCERRRAGRASTCRELWPHNGPSAWCGPCRGKSNNLPFNGSVEERNVRIMSNKELAFALKHLNCRTCNICGGFDPNTRKAIRDEAARRLEWGVIK